MLETFRALSDPSRLQIVELLSEGPLSVGELVDRLEIRQPQTSKHLRVLSQAGLVEVRARAQRRIYALRADPLREMDRWLDRYRALWEEQFDPLDPVPLGPQSEEKPDRDKGRRRKRTSLSRQSR